MINAPDIPPIYNEDYEAFYGYIDYTNKVILDIGADYGSTASFFFKKGAKKVIAVEPDPELNNKMVMSFKDVPELIPINIRIENSEQYNELITKYKPDIFKSDCEGCENFLLGSPLEIIKSIPEYVIEIHNHESHKLFCDLFESTGYNKIRDWNWTDAVWMSYWIKDSSQKGLNTYTTVS